MAPPEISPPPSPRLRFSALWEGQSNEYAFESDIGGETLSEATLKLELHVQRFLDNRDFVAMKLLEQQENLMCLLERRHHKSERYKSVSFSKSITDTFSDYSAPGMSGSHIFADDVNAHPRTRHFNTFHSENASSSRTGNLSEDSTLAESELLQDFGEGLVSLQEVNNEESDDHHVLQERPVPCQINVGSDQSIIPTSSDGNADGKLFRNISGNTHQSGDSAAILQHGTSASAAKKKLSELATPPKAPTFHAQVPVVWSAMLKARRSKTLALTSNRKLGVFDEVTKSVYYEAVMMLVIISNAAYVGWSVQHAAQHGLQTIDTEIIVTFIFNGIYILDLFARLFFERCSFFCGAEKWWNAFDMLVVLVMIAESMLQLAVYNSKTGSRVAVLRMFRVLRLMSLVHVIQYLFHVFREFRVLLYSIKKTGVALFWSLVLYTVTVYFFSIVMTQGALGSCGEAGNLPDSHDACRCFGSLDRTLINLYVGALGGLLWGELEDSAEALGWQYSLIIIFFASFIKLIVLNVITGMMLEIYGKVSRSAQHVMIEDVVTRQKKYVKIMRQIFKEIDLNDSGGISYDEFKHALQDRRMTALLESLDVDVSNAPQIFALLDKDRTGALEIDEFIFGLMRMKGEAKSVDVLRLQVDTEWIMNQLKKIREKIDELSGTSHKSRSHRHPPPSPQSASVLELYNRGDSLKNHPKAPSLTRARQKVEVMERVSHMRQTMTKSKSLTIPSTEERAMTLANLQSIGSLINRRCDREEWKDARTGKALRPKDVNLYHFNYYVICPETAPGGVEVRGLDQKIQIEQQPVVQTDLDFGSSLAEGVVTESRNDNPVFTITKGRFQCRAEGSQSDIRVDGTSVGSPVEIIPVVSLSYKEVQSPTPTRARWFCSHWWGEPVVDFIKCCEHHAALRVMDVLEAAYWVCAYANRQHSLDDDLSEDPDQSAFRKAMKVAYGVLLILDSMATPFKRIWCDFELYHTLSDGKPLDIVTIKGQGDHRTPHLLSQEELPRETIFTKTKRESSFPINVLVSGLCARLEDGDASHAPDKPLILKSMARNKQTGAPGSDTDLAFALELANGMLHSYLALAAWPQAVKKACVQDFDPQNPGTLCLRDVLASVTYMQSFNLSLAHIQEVTDNDLRVLAKSFPESVTRLCLSFEGCTNITDSGITALLQALPPGLIEFSLDCQGCKRISDNGLEALGVNLPPGLRHLDLHFATCPLIGMEGVRVLADALPKTIVQFGAGFQGTQVNKKFNSVKMLKKFADGGGRKKTLRLT